MGEKLSEGPSPVKKTNKSGVARIKFVDLNIWSRDYVSLEISKKRGLSINPDIHHSKVPSSEFSNRHNWK